MTWTPSHHLHNVQLSKCYLYQSQGALRNPQQVTQRKRIRIFSFFFPSSCRNSEWRNKARSSKLFHSAIWYLTEEHKRLTSKGITQRRRKSPTRLPKKTSCPRSSFFVDKYLVNTLRWCSGPTLVRLCATNTTITFQSQVINVNILRNTQL